MSETELKTLTNDEVDAIGEILNISMGSAATAVSTMLDKQVIITTPRVVLQKFGNVNYATLEPAMLVKIEYVEGITGANVMVFRQSDMQIILNLLMGNEDGPSEDFVFDELSMSAACEVMNQMMGASATALSEFLGKTINISTPTATVLDSDHDFENAMGVDNQEDIVSVAFNLSIEGVMQSEFISVLSMDLARMIVNQVMGGQEEAAPPPPPPAPAKPAAQAAPPPQAAAPPMPSTAAAVPEAQTAMPQMPPQAPPGYGQQPGVPPGYGQPGQMPPPYDPNAMPPGYPYPSYPMYPYGYPPMPMPGAPAAGQQGTGQPSNVIKQGVNVQSAQFPSFANSPPVFNAPISAQNMNLLMNVPLSISVEIGKTKRKIKDIMDFNQGTVIELEKQAGAPVDIVVNGQLIARGDVVVIDDNFGVRVTEIVGTKEQLIDSLDTN